MKILKSAPISAFGGLNYVIEEAINLNINKILDANLPKLPKQAKYNWFDLIMSYWSVFFCGGDCAEDLAINLREGLKKNPLIQIPSPDRILSRIKNLADTPNVFVSKRGRKEHQFSLAKNINRLNLKLLPLLSTFEKDNVVLDYDNTIIFSECL